MTQRRKSLAPAEILAALERDYSGLRIKASYGETAAFYNPGGRLPNGVYFLTIKESDGPNDRASQLDRPGVYRVAWGLPRELYEAQFEARPPRPEKGGVVAGKWDFTQPGRLTPHPVYAWIGWVQILTPTEREFAACKPGIEASYAAAVKKFEKNVRARA